MSETISLPELCRSDLLKLFAQAKSAEHTYKVASNMALMALGLDPREDHRLDLDTGVISLALKKESASPDAGG